MALPDRLTPVLDVRDLHAGYGRADAVAGVSLRVYGGTVVSIIGQSGSGKSAVLLALAGVLRLRRGAVTFAGQTARRIPTHEAVRRGIVLVPQGRSIFGGLTVRENLVLGAWTRRDRWSIGAEVDAFLERFPTLGSAANRQATTLAPGERQLLAIARGLMSRPQVMLIDEPSADLDPDEIARVLRVIKQVCVEDVCVLLAERPAPFAFALADYVYVLEGGRIVREGSSRNMAM